MARACAYVCMCVCMHVFCGDMYVCVCVRMCVCMYFVMICIYVRVCILMCMCVFVCWRVGRVDIPPGNGLLWDGDADFELMHEKMEAKKRNQKLEFLQDSAFEDEVQAYYDNYKLGADVVELMDVHRCVTAAAKSSVFCFLCQRLPFGVSACIVILDVIVAIDVLVYCGVCMQCHGWMWVFVHVHAFQSS